MSKNLKIAIIGSRGYPYIYSGYETLVKELSERLVLDGHDIRVYCHRALFKEKPKFVNGIKLIYTLSIETKFLSQFINSIFSFTHACFSDVDVIFVVNSANGPFGILTKIFGKRTCINVDGLEWLRPKWRGLGSMYFYFASKLATIFYDEIITDSFEMNKVYKNHFKKDSKVIAYGSTMTKTKSTDLMDKYKLKKNNYYLIVGRLIPDNNSLLICKAFLISKSNKKIVIVGDVPYEDSYAKKIKSIKSDKVVLTGYVKCQENLTQLYKNCYAYVHGHEFGGTNPTMINALDLNCNIIALDTKFNREMLKRKKAIFFNKNTNSLNDSIIESEKIFNLTDNKNLNYKMPKIYDWDYIAKQYLDLFDGITNSRNK